MTPTEHERREAERRERCLRILAGRTEADDAVALTFDEAAHREATRLAQQEVDHWPSER